jgi:Protein of unknown function (DUF3800)
VVCRKEPYSLMKHALLSAYGSKWAKRYLAMYTIYIDDSGSSPDHKMVVASGIIFPAKRLVQLEKEWGEFLQSEGISDFHTSECLARNPKSAFAGWDDERVERAFARIREITLKYSVQAFCIAIYKKDYDEVMPEDMRKRVGSYYTWAVSSVLGMAYDWATTLVVPVEYVFDTAGKEIEREIIEAMEYSEDTHNGHFKGNFSFRKRKDVPALQLVDLFAWTCYQAARHSRLKHPIHDLAQKSWDSYWNAYKGRWCKAESLNRDGIELWVKNNYLSPEDLSVKEFKDQKKEARKPKNKTQPNPK